MNKGDYIAHETSLETYCPPAHTGTVNVRLTDRDFSAGFEMVLGRLAPGAEAQRHHHDGEHQAIYVLKGVARVKLGDDAPRDCEAGTVVRIPPGLDHHVVNPGDGELELVIVYSPPLAPRVEE